MRLNWLISRRYPSFWSESFSTYFYIFQHDKEIRLSWRISIHFHDRFKKRYYQHKASFDKSDLRTETTLAAYIWNLKDYGVPYTIRWSIIDRGKAYSPVTNTCRLCLLEKLHILYHPDTATLNNRSEIFTKCPHKEKWLFANSIWNQK